MVHASGCKARSRQFARQLATVQQEALVKRLGAAGAAAIQDSEPAAFACLGTTLCAAATTLSGDPDSPTVIAMASRLAVCALMSAGRFTPFV